MAGYTLAPAAKRDIAGIRAWIARDNPSAARKLIERIRAKFRMLVRQPQIGEAWAGEPAAVRFVIEGNYVLYYVIQRGRVRIVRVLHGARDVRPRHIDEDAGDGA